VSCNNGYAVVYDISGTYLSVFDKNGKLWSSTSENDIISASVDDSGRLVLCTDESGYKGSVTVYNSSGTALYKWYSGAGYVLDAQMINKTQLMVLSLQSEGSCLTKLSINSEQEDGSVLIQDDMVIDFCVMSSGKVCAISDSGVYMANVDTGEYEMSYSYDGRYLDKYSLGDDYIIMSLLNYRLGSAGQIVSINSDGSATATADNVEQIVSISCSGQKTAILYSTGLSIYSPQIKQTDYFEDAGGAQEVLMRSDGSAAAIFSHSAKIF
jgi:hypothetical protein